MAHVRQSIRDNIVTAVTSLSTTGSNVFRSRVYPIGTNKLPALCVYTDNETIEFNRMDRTRDIDRTVEVVIEAYVRATANYDTTLDTICAEVEAGMAADVTRGGHAKDCKLIQTEFDFSDEGDRPIGTARLTYSIDYRTAENAATSAT